MLTAISVARECGMVKPHQKVANVQLIEPITPVVQW